MSISVVTDLTDNPGTVSGDVVTVSGYSAVGDGGGGSFQWDPSLVYADSNGGTVIASYDVTGLLCGCWVRVFSGAVDVMWFGAKGLGNVDDDDSGPIGKAIDAASTGPGQVHIPAGKYYCKSPIVIPGSSRALSITGAGRSEVSDAGTKIMSAQAVPGDPLFEMGGAINYLVMGSMSIGAAPGTTGTLIRSKYNIGHSVLSGFYFSTGDVKQRFVEFDGVESHFVEFRDIRGVMAAGSTVPAFDIRGSAGACMSSMLFRRMMINSSDSATAPIIKVENPGGASPGFVFDGITLEQPNGGGIHLYSLAYPVLRGVFSADSAAIHAPTILFDNHPDSAQRTMDPRIEGCMFSHGDNTYPDVRMARSCGGRPDDLIVIGSRIITIDSVTNVTVIGSSITRYLGNTMPLRLARNKLMGVTGIQGDHTPGMTDRAKALCGSVSFSGHTYKTVTLPEYEIDTDYKIFVSGDTGDHFWVEKLEHKTLAPMSIQFKILTENATTANVDWLLVR